MSVSRSTKINQHSASAIATVCRYINSISIDEQVSRLKIGLAVLCFYTKTGFWPSYSTDLDKILQTRTEQTCGPAQTAIGAWASAGQTRTTMILQSCKSPQRRRIAAISAANRQMEERTAAIVKNSGILQRGRSQIQKQDFSRLQGTLRLSCAQSTKKQFYPKPMVPMESRDSVGVPFASLENLWQIQAPERCRKVVT